MAVNEMLTCVLAGLAGATLGATFFGSLLWTTRKGLASDRPAVWFLGSGVLRMGVVLVVLYLVGGGQWQRLVSALGGFSLARFIVMWRTQPRLKSPKPETSETRHAP